jgi:hypothetical protein
MKYLKTFEASSHWLDDIYDKVKFERTDQIGDLFYDFIDFGFDIRTDFYIKRAFDSPGKRLDYLEDGVDLYKLYSVILHDKYYDQRNINRIIEIKEAKIELLNRLITMGFKIDFDDARSYTKIEIYNIEEDKIDKNLYLLDLIDSPKYKQLKGVNSAFDRLKNTFSKIADVWIPELDKDCIIVQPIRPSKYTLDQLYSFVGKVLKDEFDIKKVSIMKNEAEPQSLEIRRKKLK